MEWSGWQPIDVAHNLCAADGSPMGVGRAPGLHLGAIIKVMREAAGMSQGAPEGDQDGVRLQEGFLWEKVVELVLGGMPQWEAWDLVWKEWLLKGPRAGVVTQLRLERDGIHMTPDAWDPKAGILESYKVTRKKLPHTQSQFETNFWPWLTQEQAYALAAGVDTVRWYVLFAAGDYSKGPGTGPKAVMGTATFTAEELVNNWAAILVYRDSVPKEQKEW